MRKAIEDLLSDTVNILDRAFTAFECGFWATVDKAQEVWDNPLTQMLVVFGILYLIIIFV